MDVVASFIANTKLAKKQNHQNMTIFPILSANGYAPDYLVLDQAMEADLVEVTEVDDEGEVPELRLVDSRMSDIRSQMSDVRPAG